jgi:hypothetical protein
MREDSVTCILNMTADNLRCVLAPRPLACKLPDSSKPIGIDHSKPSPFVYDSASLIAFPTHDRTGGSEDTIRQAQGAGQLVDIGRRRVL